MELDISLTWDSAEAKANTLGGRLATVDEAKFYANYVKIPVAKHKNRKNQWVPVTDSSASNGRGWVRFGKRY